MRILNWNIEWMNRWFTGNATPDWGSRELTADDARAVAGRVARVISRLDPDVICLQEGPSAKEEMQLFLDTCLTDGAGAAAYEALIGADGREQKLYVLRKRGGAASGVSYSSDPATLALRDAWDADVNGDLLLEPYDFTRLPLVVDVTYGAGKTVRIIVLHTKSKYVHQGQKLFDDPATRQAFVSMAMVARRRISAEGFRLRTYLDAALRDDAQARIIVAGDFNDGPGQDLFERSYLTHNVTDILLGSTFYPALIFHHPVLASMAPEDLYTAIFDDFVDDIPDRRLLLDHFVVSPALRPEIASARIAHAEYEAELIGDGEGARTRRPSDHRPLFLDLN